MGDSRETNEDITDEDEAKVIPPSRILLHSLGRQFYCLGGVLAIPTFESLTRSLGPRNYKSMEAQGYVAECIGALLAGCFLHFLGRKYAVFVSNAIFSLLLLLVYATCEGPYVDFKVILVCTLHRNFSHVACILYIAEITSPTFLAFFIGLYFFSFNVGFELMRIMTLKKKVAQLFLYCSLISVCLSIFSLLIPETPLWLALKDNRDKAADIFTWIRAGTSDTNEFEQMLERTDDIKQCRFKGSVFSQTFAMCTLFSCLLTLIFIDTCYVQTTIMNDYYFAKLVPNDEFNSEVDKIAYKYYRAIKDSKFQNRLPGILLFLGLNFVVPRKIILAVGFILGMLLTVPVLMKPEFHLFMKISPFCHTIYGTIFPVLPLLYLQIFPVTSREYGVTLSSIFFSLHAFLYLTRFTRAKHGVGYLATGQVWTYLCVIVSFIGLPFLLIFMPETKGMNMYELDEMKLSIPGTTLEKRREDEDVEEA